MPDRWRAALAEALADGVHKADQHHGRVAAAVWVDGLAEPVAAGDIGQGRLWSLSKPVAAIAVLQAVKGAPSADVTAAIRDAIAASDNCAQRRVVLELQRLTKSMDAAEAAFASVLKQAGAGLAKRPQRGGIDEVAACRRYLAAHGGGLADPFGTALLFGTAEWRLRDEIRFAHALAGGAFGAAGDAVLDAMRLPKQRPASSSPRDYTAALTDPPSAGPFPSAWRPAYKGGWGGHALGPPDYRMSEIVVLRVAAHAIAIVASFSPAAVPASDDPGLTEGPQALRALFERLQAVLEVMSRPG